MARLRATYHVEEWKKPWTPPNVDPITAGFFLFRTRPQTRARRTGPAAARRRERRWSVHGRGSSYGFSFLVSEVGKEIQRAGHEHLLPELVGEGERSLRLLCGVNGVEAWARQLGDRFGRQRPRVGRGGRDERAAGAREAVEDPGGVLVAEDRRDDDV